MEKLGNEQESCWTCRFRSESRCRRFPPTVFMVSLPPKILGGQSGGISFASQSSLVQPDDWCGEFKINLQNIEI